MSRWVVPPTMGTTIPGLKNLLEPNAIGEEGEKSHSHSLPEPNSLDPCGYQSQRS